MWALHQMPVRLESLVKLFRVSVCDLLKDKNFGPYPTYPRFPVAVQISAIVIHYGLRITCPTYSIYC